ncbi:protein kinase [Streptomyces sp. NPDC048337]|uniref:protein kinase domain-containing protein n=1 Tax=Streptomyces sp. NPDC048337 TaxID=3365535 RepID=UPI00371C732A
MQDMGLLGPTHVGPFRVLAVLGQGGMGRVLLGAAPDGRLVAVKQVHAELAEDDGFRARFRREVDASRRVSGAYTAAVMDADPDAPTPWLASQFVPGPSLGEALDAGGPLPEPAVRLLAAGLAQALVDVHRAGLIHRDLKPSNVLLAEDGVRVIDFGIVRAVGEQTRITHTGALIGSPAFMSPEQILGRELTPASDVFALGATLVMACTGQAPFSAPSVPRLLHEVVNAEPDLGAVPAGLREVVARCLAKDPAARPSPQELPALVGRVEPSARPWPDAVNGLIAGQRAEIAALSEMPVPPSKAPRRRRSWKVRSLVGVALVAALVGGLLTVGRPLVQEVYFLVVPEDVPLPGGVPLAQVQDKYTGKVPATCEEIVGKVTVPPAFDPPRGNGRSEGTRDWEADSVNFCVWNSRSGDEIYLGWDLYLAQPGGKTGAERAKSRHEGLWIRGLTKRDPAIGFAEEAFWKPPRKASDSNCVLYVRDVNLDIFVSVQGKAHPPGQCESVAKDLARSGMTVVAKR